METTPENPMNKQVQWFVMRDLKRTNAKLPAYMMLEKMGFKVFTPMCWVTRIEKGRRVRKHIPFLQDLLFVHETKDRLNGIVEKEPTLQFRYLRGAYCEPMTVKEKDMNRFVHAVETADNPRFYQPEEVLPSMIGRRVRIIGGQLDGYEGNLLSVRGLRSKRLYIELSNLLAASVEVNPEFIQLL